MDNARDLLEDGTGESRLLRTLEQLLALEGTDLRSALDQASQKVAEAVGADKVDAMFHDPTTDTLVAVGTSPTPMGHRQVAIGMDRLPVVNGGREVEVFLTGTPYLTRHADQDPEQLPGIIEGLGVRSAIIVPLAVDGQRRGVFVASAAAPERFSEKDPRFLQAVARWIGALAHRAELVERIAAEATERGRQVAAEELITVLAHDLGNHLAPLKARIDLLRRRAGREGRARDVNDADEAIRALQRFSRLITDLLAAARLEQGIFVASPQPVDLASLARETSEVFATREIRMDVWAPDELIVHADPDRIRQALENLLANAVKHSPEQGIVVIEVGTEPRTDGEWATVTVSDQGPGLPPELLPRLFNRFTRGSASSGLGLGLYLASRIADIHGGTLAVDSRPGEGATFRLTWPVAERPSTDGSTAPAASVDRA